MISGVTKLTSMYHFTLDDAGLKGLNIVMIKSTQRHKLSNREKDWKKRKKSEFDQHNAFKYYIFSSKPMLNWNKDQAKI